MLDNIKISYHRDGVVTTMEMVDDYTDNLPYVLADMFKRVIDDTNANPDIVIKELKDYYDDEA
jgi:hypothetical protein